MRNQKIGIALSYLNTGVNMICGLFLSSFLLRILGDTEYGIYQTVASFANYLILLEFGTGTVMTRNIAMCRGRNGNQAELQRNVTTIWTLACILGLVIAAVAAVCYCNLDAIYAATLDAAQIQQGKRIFLFVTVYLIGSFLMQTLNGIILAFEHYRYGAALGICRTALRTTLLTVLLSRKQAALLIAQVDAGLSIGLLCVSVFYIYRHFGLLPKSGRMDRGILRTAAPLSAALFLQTIVNQANNNVDKFLIGIKLSPESVALYSVAMYVFSVFSSLTTIPISMFAPAVIRQVQQDPTLGQLDQTLRAPCRMTAMIGGMVYFGFIAMGRPFVELVYGENYASAWLIAVIIMTPMYLNMINGVLVNVLDALNKRMVRSGALLATTAMNIALTILWLDWWGEIGAALATALCTTLGQVALMNWYYSRKLKIPALKLFRDALAGILPWFVIGCGVTLLVGSRIDSLAVSLAVRFALFCGIVCGGYLLRGIGEQEKEALKKLLHRR